MLPSCLCRTQLTLVKVQDGESDLVCPGGSLLQPDAVAGAAEEVARRDQVAVPRSLELQPRAVPDERVQAPAKVRIVNTGKSNWILFRKLKYSICCVKRDLSNNIYNTSFPE